jgi:hypothetical protein
MRALDARLTNDDGDVSCDEGVDQSWDHVCWPHDVSCARELLQLVVSRVASSEPGAIASGITRAVAARIGNRAAVRIVQRRFEVRRH